MSTAHKLDKYSKETMPGNIYSTKSNLSHVDDDNTFEPNALSELLAFWNLEANKLDEKPLAGVSFNVIDLPKINNSL